MVIRWKTETFPVGATRSILCLPDGLLLGANTRRSQGSEVIFCVHSTDKGRHWQDSGQITADPEPGTDMGDGALFRLRRGDLLYCYRHNHYRDAREKTPDYAIRIAVSKDNGRHWEAHSTVVSHTLTEKKGPSQGLWAPFLFETPEGNVQCYYDDERTPLESGFPGHQWLMMRTWEPRFRTWRDPTIVSRAHDPKHLSRDGMGTVVALSRNRLLCALESVQVMPPHANVVRFVTSDDGGKTWSWRRGERGVLYQPAKPNYMALSLYLTRLTDGTAACIFCTDEDREKPDRSGTPPHQLNMDIKLITSQNGGISWSEPQTISDSHRAYLPGMVQNRDGTLLAVWMDFAAGKTLGKMGIKESPAAVTRQGFP